MFSRFGDAVSDHYMAVVQMHASLAQRVAQLRQRDVGVGAQMLGQPTGHGDQRLFATGRERQHGRRARSAVVRDRAADRGRGSRLGEHDVGIGAPETERIHPDYPSFVVGKRPARPWHVQLQLREGDVPRGSFEMQIGRDVSVLDHQCSLDQSGYPGTCLEMADVGLDRPDQKGLRSLSIRRQRACKRSHLDGITDRRSGPVRFDVSDLGRVDARPPKCRADRGFLGLLSRNRDAVGMTVLRHRRAQDLRVDVVTVVDRLLKRLDDDDSAAFSACVPVRGIVECSGTSSRAEESALRFRDGGVGADHDVHAAGQGELAFAVPNALRCKVDGDERTGARRVDRHAGPAEVEGVRYPVGQHRHHHPDGGMRLEAVATGVALILQQLIVQGEAADEYADVGAGHAVGRYSRVFQCFPRGV